MTHNSKAIGQQSEAEVLPRLFELFENVLLPWGDNERYDFVVEHKGRFLRLQCKTGRLTNGGVKFNTCSSSAHRTNGSKRDYRGQIDAFVVWCPENQQTYLVPVDEAGRVSCTLRTEPARNNQVARLLNAEVYRVADALPAAFLRALGDTAS